MTVRELELGFFASYAVTGVALAAVLFLGKTRRIRAHVAAVASYLVGFLVVLGFAETLGRKLRFDPVAERVHLPLAVLGTVLVLAPIVTGVRRWLGRGSLRAHRIAIVAYLVVFLAASATGFYMLSTGVE